MDQAERRERNKDKPKLWVVPATVQKANEFVNNLHRQHHETVFGRWAIACIDSTGLVHGVVIVGNPVGRALDDGISLEVQRCCTDGTPNAPSILYGAAWRLARSMGYRSMYTYTLGVDFNETGGSLRALGWTVTHGTGGSPWNHQSRSSSTGIEKLPLVKKDRWEVHDETFFPVAEIRWPIFVRKEERPIDTLWGDIPIVERSDDAEEKHQKLKRAKIRNTHAEQLDS